MEDRPHPDPHPNGRGRPALAHPCVVGAGKASERSEARRQQAKNSPSPIRMGEGRGEGDFVFMVEHKQVTMVHYSDDLGLPVGFAKFYSLSEKPPEPEPSVPEDSPSPAGRLRIVRGAKNT
jgi:hypothetical protein